MKFILKLALLPLIMVFRVGRRRSRAPEQAAPGQGTPRSPWPRRLLTVSGSIVLVTGLSLLAFGTYQMLNEEPEHKPGAKVAVLSFTDTTGTIYDRPVPATPTPSPAPTPLPPPPPPLRDSPYRIRMPKIGVDAAVVTYGLDSNNVPEVPYNGWEVAWYNFSARPGTGSNAVFAGHVTWSGHAVFYDLDQLVPGDDIYLEGTDGTKVYYKVSEVFLVDATDPNSLSVMGPTQADTVTVITCGGDYFYVGGVAQYDYTHRLVVRAGLTGIQPGAAAAAQAGSAGGG